MTQLTLGWTVCVLLTATAAGSRHHSRQQKTSSGIVHQLFNKSNYVPDLLPLCSTTETVNVKIGMALRGILDVDEPRQIVKVNVWLRWSWNDCRLRWNATEFGGIDHIVISSRRLWIPDITLYDSADGHFGNLAKTRAQVYSDGEVNFKAPSIMTFTCPMHIKYFPFDRQLCLIKFASWSYHGLDLNVSNASASADTTVFVDNGEWNLLQISSRRNTIKYACCDEPYPDVTFYMHIQRQHLYYLFNLVMPCILITGVALLVFYLPPESGEKISLGITVLLSLCVFLLMVSERMPATSESVPLIAQYFASTICLVSMSCGVTVVILHIHHKSADGRDVPRWARVLVIDCLGRMLCMRRPVDISEQARAKDADRKRMLAEGIRGNNVSVYSNNSCQPRHYNDDNDGGGLMTSTEAEASIPGVLGEQLRVLRQINHNIADQDSMQRIAGDWRKLAMILDRLFFIIFTVVTVAVTLSILVPRCDSETDMMLAKMFSGEQSDAPAGP